MVMSDKLSMPEGAPILGISRFTLEELGQRQTRDRFRRGSLRLHVCGAVLVDHRGIGMRNLSLSKTP